MPHGSSIPSPGSQALNLDQMPQQKKPVSALPEPPEKTPGNGEQASSSAWVNINAAFPNLLLAGFYALAAFWRITLSPMDRHWLGTLMGIEFLVIHSFPFMMFIGSSDPPDEKGRKCRMVAFWGLFVIYFLFAAKLGGLSAVVAFAGLTVTTYLGYMLRRTAPDAVAQLAARWAMSFLAFMICAAAAGMPEDVDDWPDHGRVLYFGLMYFLALGVLEATGFYQWRVTRTLMEQIRQQFAKNRH